MAGDLNETLTRLKARFCRRLDDSLEYGIARNFGNRPAAFAREYDLPRPITMRRVARKKGIAAFKPVHQPHVHQTIQGAIDGDRCETAAAPPRKTIQDIVSPDRGVGACDLSQDILTKRRQALAGGPKCFLGA